MKHFDKTVGELLTAYTYITNVVKTSLNTFKVFYVKSAGYFYFISKYHTINNLLLLCNTVIIILAITTYYYIIVVAIIDTLIRANVLNITEKV